MIISLKNNKKLLGRRKTYFDRKHSHEALRRIYSNRIGRNEKPLTEEEKRKIRQRIRADFKRENRIKFLVVIGCTLLIPTAGFFVFSGLTLRSEAPESEIRNTANIEAYNESIGEGVLYLKKNQPFFAIGHFQNALDLRPNDPLAIEKLILSYQLLCEQNEKTCELAKTKIDSLKAK